MDPHSTIFSVIDSQAKAYLLGWVAARGVSPTGFLLEAPSIPAQLLQNLRGALPCQLPPVEGTTRFEVNDEQVVVDLYNLLHPVNSETHPNERMSTTFPDLGEFTWHFARAYIEATGGFTNNRLHVGGHPEFLAGFSAFSGYTPVGDSGYVVWFDPLPTLDILSMSHTDYLSTLTSPGFAWADVYENIIRQHSVGEQACMQYTLSDGGVAPSKGCPSDSGFDLHLIRKTKEVGVVQFFDTGVAVKPMEGTYFELFPRSSMAKTGYILANSTGIIDATYRGTIKVALIKVDPTAPDLELPCRMVQIIPKRLILCATMEVEELDRTARGQDGGIVRD